MFNVASARKLLTRKSIKLSKAWELFLETSTRPDSGPATLNGYRRFFLRFRQWLAKKYPIIQDIGKITEEIAIEYADSIWAQADGTIIKADLWIDNSGALAKLAGAELLYGEDPKSRFNEPDAPKEPISNLNGATLIFRISPSAENKIEALPDDIRNSCWWAESFPVMSCVEYPNGDWNCNMLPTISGKEYLELGEEKAYIECTRRVKAFWHHIQTNYPEFQSYRIKEIAKNIGIRETFRVMCEYMLNENDLIQGITKQKHSDIIAISDHMMDSHGAENRKSGELHEHYGIPYRCLIPKGFTNLLVVGRIAGFSSIAASSCRLSRTMMQLGQAAGTATTQALSDKNFTK